MNLGKTAKCLIATAILFAAHEAYSQDTLVGPKSNYYFQRWYGGNYMPYDTIASSDSSDEQACQASFFGTGDLCKIMHTDTLLEIHGIAAALYAVCGVTRHPAIPFVVDSSRVDDLSTDSVFEYLRLYVPNKDWDSMILINQGRVHYTEDPFDHYLRLEYLTSGGTPFYRRVYEVYFDTVSYVIGDFGVGISQINSTISDENSNPVRWKTWPIGILSFNGAWFNRHYHEEIDKFDTIWIEHPRWDTDTWPWTRANIPYRLYIFPILDHNCHIPPAEDTTNHSAIQTPADLGTVLQPNPATETAKVISSFGLTRIEAFNTAGDRIYDAPHTGYSATLDVSRWPSGTYIIRLHTPVGTVPKRLVVQ